jgi:hypothetical protein
LSQVTEVSQHNELEHSEIIIVMNEKEIEADLNDSGMGISGKGLPDI